MKSPLLRALSFAILGSSMAVAQNSDLGVLLGVSLRPSATITPGRIESSVSASGQINYAIQLHEASAGLLYLELPLMIAGTRGSVVSGQGSPYVSASNNNTVFFTPGVRLHYTIHPRIALYGSGGGGLAVLNGRSTYVGAGIINTSNGNTVTGAFGFGGGLDFRLTRLLSLRAEGRNFVTRAGLGGESGHNHAFFTVGVGFHF